MAITTNLQPCVVNALRALAEAALNALKTTLIALITQLQAQLTALILKATPLQILKAQLEAQAALVRAAKEFVENVANLFPTDDGPCVQLSFMNLGIADSLAPITETLDEIENN